ncbi:coiled-coil domain-containing protein 18 [Gastrophryne carolinensis]
MVTSYVLSNEKYYQGGAMEVKLPPIKMSSKMQGSLAQGAEPVRSRLMQKEQSFWTLKGYQSCSDSVSEHSLSKAPLGLTLEDLEKPSYCQPRATVSRQKNSMVLNERDSLRSAHETAASLSSSGQENRKLREKINSLQEKNDSLSSQNHSLVNKIKSMRIEITKSKSKVCHYESAVGNHSSRIPELEEHIISLEAEVDAREKALTIVEDKLEESHHIIIEKEELLLKFQEELKNVKMELYECSKQFKRTEKQRNEALCNAEELTRAFQHFKKSMVEKMEKAQKEEAKRSKILQDCEKEKEALQERCQKLESELENVLAQLRNIMSEKKNEEEKQRSTVVNNTELISLLAQSNQRILRLESDLANKEKVFIENTSLLQEIKELKSRVAKFEEHKTIRTSSCEPGSTRPLSPAENYDTRMKEDASKPNATESSLLIMELRAQLSLKEAENRELHTRLLNINSSHSLDVEPEKLTIQQTEAEKYLQLETTNEHLMMAKEKLTDVIKELQRKLSRAQSEIANTKLSMVQRTSQFQHIQEELLEKASKTTKLELEVKKKSSKIASLQKQVEEKTQACSLAIARNTELEVKLEEFKAQILHLEENFSKEHREVFLAFEKSKTIHQDQRDELMKQIEHLQCQLEMKNLQTGEQEFTIKSLQEEIVLKQQQLTSLDSMLTETRKELDHQTRNTTDAIKVLENQVGEETVKVRQLESALAICKEELGLYLQQLEDNRKEFERQSNKKSEEVLCLRKEIKLKTQSLRETSDENVRLQQTLLQQQQMLQQETTRIGELEDNQTQLEKQISKLEYELEKQRSTFQGEFTTKEEKLEAANKELALKTQQVHQLNSSVKKLKCELDKCNENLMHTEGQILAITADGELKNNKLGQMDLILQKTQTELDDKTQLVTLLQESMNRASKDVKRKEELELEIQHLHKEAQDNLKHMEELQETLTKTHLLVEEKEIIIQALTEELRTCKNEVDERDHELLDMDQALKDRNWELQQRAAQLTQLDMSIRQHKEQLEQKIIHLESALKESELEAKGRITQISSLDEKLQEMREKLRQKDFDLLQKDQLVHQLEQEIEKKQQAVAEVEQRLKIQQNCLAEQQQEGKELTQQVRLARERMQLAHRKLMETQQQMDEAKKETDRLTRKLEGVDQLSKEELQQMKEELADAQDTISNLKTELEARNEVIKATNEVLVLKESELTRLKARISGCERKLASSVSPNMLGEFDSLRSVKFPDTWRMQRSLSDMSLSDISSLDLPKNLLDDMKGSTRQDSPGTRRTIGRASPIQPDGLNDSSFNPLEYVIDDQTNGDLECPDLGTLSGMLKYIKQMKLSEALKAPSPERNLWTQEPCQEQITQIPPTC